MSDPREYTPPRPSDSYSRRMVTCMACGRWWSVGPDDADTSACCGANLSEVDMEAHMAQVPPATPGK